MLARAKPATRADVLRMAEKLRRASRLLEVHAKRCTEVEAPAHAQAMRQARRMVRAEFEQPEPT